MPDLRERQQGLSGSWCMYQGPSRTGKSYEAVRVGILSAMLTGGTCLIYAPVYDMVNSVAGFTRYYELACDKTSGEARARNVRVLDFLRSNVVVFKGRNAQGIFDRIDEEMHYAEKHHNPHSVVIDEGAVARDNPKFLELIAPLFGNVEFWGVVTGQRWMAVPPQVRNVIRYRILWRGADTTGDHELQHLMDSGFQFSPVMSGTESADQWYRGIEYTAQGPMPFQYNPHLARRPDTVLLPAPKSIVKVEALA